VNLVLFGCGTEEIDEVIDFNRSVGLPTCFADFGLADIGSQELVEHCQGIVGPSGTASFGLHQEFTAEQVADAMREVDHLAGTRDGRD
jgi:glycerol dehydrogenase-like iron-containing ADH family enzyme